MQANRPIPLPCPIPASTLAEKNAPKEPGANLHATEGELRAAIDVGTNSVKLLIGTVKGAEVTPVSEESKQTRLGAGFYNTRRLQAGPIAATAEAVATFAAKAKQLGAVSIHLMGTSAARDALNAAELIQAIHQTSNLTLEVISGDQEADWAYQGVMTDPRLSDLALLILDVGGGSSEFIVGERRNKTFSRSYKLGTVRLLESLKLNDPPGLAALKDCRANMDQFIRQQITAEIEPHLRNCRAKPQLVGTGGTATILAKIELQMPGFDREKIETVSVSLERVRTLTEWMWTHTLAERAALPGLPSKRADVILGGVIIYQSIMEQFGFNALRVSTRGLRYSALLHTRPSQP
jgi:exopolyphosphatase/guanosine-5'-triphosphate,3'-diphosphate pyrophosphatase